jgi:hypothetical protein
VFLTIFAGLSHRGRALLTETHYIQRVPWPTTSLMNDVHLRMGIERFTVICKPPSELRSPIGFRINTINNLVSPLYPSYQMKILVVVESYITSSVLHFSYLFSFSVTEQQE